MIYLGISPEVFATWAEKRDLPRDIFLRLVDIITEEEVRSVRTLSRRKAIATG